MLTQKICAECVNNLSMNRHKHIIYWTDDKIELHTFEISVVYSTEDICYKYVIMIVHIILNLGDTLYYRWFLFVNGTKKEIPMNLLWTKQIMPYFSNLLSTDCACSWCIFNQCICIYRMLVQNRQQRTLFLI